MEKNDRLNLMATPLIQVQKSIVQDAANIKNGVYAPLQGFLRSRDYETVLKKMRLPGGEIWSIPITVDIDENDRQSLKQADKAVLSFAGARVELENIEVYPYDKKNLAATVFGTLDSNHPGVAKTLKMKDYLLGGDVTAVRNENAVFPEHNLTPAQTRRLFRQRGWKTIAAFQTRNVPHRGHEFVQRHVLDRYDGLLIQPVVGEKKPGDFRDSHIISSYRILAAKFFPRDRVVINVLPLAMRYAGPREAILHALIRRNFGCTHFIVGRDHAGVGGYYRPYAAQEIFDRFRPEELGIKILKYGEVVYDQKRGCHDFIENCGHNDIIKFSGTQLREMFLHNEKPQPYLMRQEIFDHLKKSGDLFV
ncbi:MAG: sulfate adenylyltransferase [Planctomycetes bacterium]|nr:sulfate adenylyltransferase [Planctomycetota bacterium]